MPLIENDFPDFYCRADEHSARWHRRYLWAEKVQLAALLLAAGVGSIAGPPALVVVLFVTTLLSQVYRLTSKADEKWWNGRAGAESAKTAAWRFVVGGEPFGIHNQQSEVELANRMVEVAREVAKLVPVPVNGAHVTDEMRSLRSRTLDERIDAYRAERIRSQRSWYAGKSGFNNKRATIWSLVGVVSSFLALCFGIGAAIYDWSLDAVGFFSAVGASVAAWMAVKQYQTLARSYAVASAELGVIDVKITGNQDWDESSWASFVNEAEAAISREHVSWLATRVL
jgi:hypothetical protein